MTRGLFKQNEQEAYRIIMQIQNPQFQLLHVRGHQDDVKTISELYIPAKLNIEADITSTSKARTPINIHLLSAAFAIYIKGIYIPYQFERGLRHQHFSKEAKQFLMQKYTWNLQTFQFINWNSHDKSIRDTRYTQKRFITRFIHHRLPVGKMNFISEHRCPYCDIIQNQNINHDHFLQCNSLRGKKKKWIENLRTALSKKIRVFNYYESNLRETNKVDFEENYSYDSRSDSDERSINKQGKRRIIDQESIQIFADESSISGQSNVSHHSKPWRRLISRRDVTSSESEEACFELDSLESKVNSNPSLLEPFHQDLTI